MTADTLRASLLFVAEDPASCANNPTLSDLLREAAKAIATPELIALGETAVRYAHECGPEGDIANMDFCLGDVAKAARAYAASVASIPASKVGDNRT